MDLLDNNQYNGIVENINIVDNKVNVDGKIWSAKGIDDKEIKSGANVKIIAIEGVKLVVDIA